MQLDQIAASKVEDFISRKVSEVPAIDETDKSVRIKNITVLKADDQWQVTKADSVIAEFHFKAWAVAYAMAFVNNHGSTCTYLEEASRRLDRLQADRVLYRYHQKLAEQNRNELRLDILECRLNRVDQDISELVWDAHQVMRYQGFV